MSTAESVRIAQLEAELARGEEVRHSLARIATASLHALEQSIHKPVGFWIRESEEQTVDDLLEAPEVERMLATEGTWRRKTIRPLSRANSPAFASPIVPLRVAVPAEVFDLIGSFADLATASALSQVDFAWLVRSPLVKQLPDYVFQRKSRPHLLSLLAKAEVDRSTLLSRLEPHLSFGNVTELNLSASVLHEATLSGSGLDQEGLVSHPLSLECLEIFLDIIPGNYTLPGAEDLRSFEPSARLLAVFNPRQLHLRSASVLSRKGQADIALVRNAILVTRSGAAAMSAWTRLEEVRFVNCHVYVTEDDEPWVDTSTHEFFLHSPVLGAFKVFWVLSMQVNPGDERVLTGPRVLREPIKYLASCQPPLASDVRSAYLVLPDKAEREREQARDDVPSWLKIIAAVKEVIDA